MKFTKLYLVLSFTLLAQVLTTQIGFSQGWGPVSLYNYQTVTKLATNGTQLDFGAPYVGPTISSQNSLEFPYGYFVSMASFPYVDLRGMEYYNNTIHVTGVQQNTDSSRIYNMFGSIGAVDGWFNCLKSFNGFLYAGGGFTNINGQPFDNIAKWNGASWSAVGGGLNAGPNSNVKVIAVHNNQLYAVVSNGLSSQTEIYFFNGTFWSSIGTVGIPGVSMVNAMKSYNGSLYVGGMFDVVGGVTVGNIARWNGTNWSALGTGLTGVNPAMVTALEVYDNKLFAGGTFQNAGGTVTNNIASWNGTSWSTFGTGANGSINSLITYLGSLIACGNLTTINNVYTGTIARYTACNVTVTASGPTTFCGGSVTLTAPAATSYQWRVNGYNINGATSASVVASATGQYVCILNGTCGTIYSNAVYVNASGPPTATITAGGPTSFCTGGSVLLSANTSPGLTYQWKKTGVNISGATSSTYLATTTGTYSCQVFNACSGTNSNAIVVNNQTPIAFINPASGATICNGATQMFSTNSTPGYLYQWKLNGTNIVGATQSFYYATIAGNYSVQLTNAGCTTTTATSTLVVNNPAATPGSITTVGGTAKVCPGDAKSYTIAPVSGATSYTWVPPPGSVISNGQGTTSVTVTYTANFIASDTIRVRAVNACGNSAYRNLKITRNNPATPGTISGLLYGVCNQNNIAYSVTNVAGITYNWYFGSAGATINNGQGTNAITASFNGYTTGSLNVTASNGCGTSAVRTTTVKAVPAKPVSLTGATSVCANQQNVPYSIAAVPSATTYTWVGPSGSHISDGINISVSNTLITTATAVTVNYGASAGNLKVRGNNGCGSGTYLSKPITMPCRTSNNEIQPTSIFPNPASDQLFIQNATGHDAIIRDVIGKVVNQFTIDEGTNAIRIGDLNHGLYFIEIWEGNQLMYHEKFMKN